jgi:adenosylhomocysteine nucleosidase
VAELTRHPAALRKVGRHRVLFVMAAPAEYGPALRAEIEPLMTGVGPIEAALKAGIALQRLADAQCLPDLVVSLGSAGSQTLEQGRIYAVSSVSWRDMDASALGFVKGITPFVDHPVAAPLALPLPDVPPARLSTGGNVVTGLGYEAIDAEMVDMETFALLRACQNFGVPLAGFRGISDGAEELRHYDDWTRFLHVVDEGLSRIVAAIDEAAVERALAG